MNQREWTPRALVGTSAPAGPPLDRLSYIVVDELESGRAGLSVYRWPRVDEWGRVRFLLDEGPVLVGVPVETLRRFVWRHRLPRRGARRPLRIGDVFAAETSGQPPQRLDDPAEWLRPPVYDITADAREAVKAAFFAAVAPTLDPERDRESVALAIHEVPPEPGRPPGRRLTR